MMRAGAALLSTLQQRWWQHNKHNGIAEGRANNNNVSVNADNQSPLLVIKACWCVSLCVSVCTVLAYFRISYVGTKEVRIFWGKFGCIHMNKCCHCLLFCINHFDRNVFMYSLSLYSHICIQIFSYSVTSAGWFFTHIVVLYVLWIFLYKCKHKCLNMSKSDTLYVVWISLCCLLFCRQWFLECWHIDVLMLKANLGYEWPLCGLCILTHMHLICQSYD